MANRATLLNTAVLSSDIYGLYANVDKPGNEIITFCEAAYRLPIPWLCCFRQQDLRVVTIPMSADDAEFDVPDESAAPGEDQAGTQAPSAQPDPTSEQIPIPSISVAQALINLEQARPSMVDIAGNADVARDYYEEMVYYLKALPLPYITMDPIEVVFMGDLDEARSNNAGALSGDSSAIPYLKRLSCFKYGATPHAFEVFMSIASIGGTGNENAAALSSNSCDYYWHLPEGQDQPKHDLPWFKPTHRGMLLDDIEHALSEVLTGIGESPSISTQIRLADNGSGGRPASVLGTYIDVESDATAYAIANHRGFRQQLDAKYRALFTEWCERYGLTWRGVSVISQEAIVNEHDGRDSMARHKIAPLDVWREPEWRFVAWLKKLMGE